MFDRLPNELICAILRVAIETFVSVDRSTAVSIAQTSKFVYGIALPILCRRLVVTRDNMKRVAVFLDNLNTCAHVEALTAMDKTLFSKRPEVLQHFPKLSKITAPSLESSVLACVPDTASLRRVQLWGHSRFNLPSGVTHLCLWLGYADMSNLLDWVDSMPALSHLGLEVGLQYHRGVTSQPIVRGLRTLLYDNKCRCLKRLAVRVEDSDLQEDTVRAFFDFILQNYPDPRIYVWLDRRLKLDADEVLRLDTEDQFAGRDIWSESRPWRELLLSGVTADHLSEL